MAPKRIASARIMSVVKKVRRVINLETKLDIIRRWERGHSGASIARALGLRDSTVRTIIKNGERIKRISKEKSLFKIRNTVNKIQETPVLMPVIPKTVSLEIEKELTAWYAKEVVRGNVIDFEEFQRKALTIYKQLTKDYNNNGLFSTNSELFEFCKQNFNVQSTSDTSSEAASADIEDINSIATNYCEVTDENNAHEIQSANGFSQIFYDVVEQHGYTPMQIFNVRETNLFWKRLPMKDINSKLDVKDTIDHMTLLFGCNAAGDFKLKPLLVYLTENPKALRGYPKDKLPVIWKSNKKAMVTQLIFSDWFTSYFCPIVEQYCIKNSLENKILLVVDSAPGHPTSLDDLSANVKVIYLPQNASSLLQPLNETFMKIFKAYYQYKVLSQALIECENSECETLTFHEFWRTYNIKKAINNIIEAWNEIKPSTMNKIWRQLYPSCVTDFLGFEDDIQKIQEYIRDIAKELHLGDIDINYFQEELNFSRDNIKGEQWNQITNQRKDTENEEIQIRSLSINILGEAIKNLEAAMAMFIENDPDFERSSSVCCTIKNAITSYRHLYREKKKTAYFSFDKQRKQLRCIEYPEQTVSSPELQSTNSNEPQPSNIPLDIKLEFSPAESPSSNTDS